MKKEEFRFRSASDLCDIRAVRYVPEKKIKAILQIAHGMVEFIDRYENFASFMCEQGYLVVGNDHIGHGGSVNSEEDWGYFGENGNETVLKDMYQLTKLVKEEYPDLPYYLLGHSMGSFYARQYLGRYGEQLSAAIIMGTGFEPAAKIKGAMLLCKVIAAFKGWKYRSSFVNQAAFGSYNKKFEPVRTTADWLTKDEKIVDAYLNEPRDTFIFTLNGFYSMFTGIVALHDEKLLNKVPKDLPLLFVSGEDDPVGSFGKEVKNSVDSLKNVGVHHIDMKLYPGDRHEILNELDKQQVYEDLLYWLENRKLR